jgi:DNA polymerase-4
LFGVWGPLLGAAARGEDGSPVVPYHARPKAKSIGHEYTLPRDERDRGEVRRILLGLCDEVSIDLRSEGWKAGAVHLKLRWSDWKSISRQRVLDLPTDSGRRMYNAGLRLFEQNDSGSPVRLIGVSASHLVPAARVLDPSDLFGFDGEGDLDRTIDQLRDSFGRGVLRRASLMSEAPRGEGPNAGERSKNRPPLGKGPRR